MFLLFPPRRWITAAVKEHLHSNMFLLFRATAASSLAAFNSFTFQYVSIISLGKTVTNVSPAAFTFQYVSIIS